MTRETTIWTLLFVCGAMFVAVRATTSVRGVGQQFVIPVEVVGIYDAEKKEIVPHKIDPTATYGGELRRSVRYDSAQRGSPEAVYSFSRSVGVWVAAILTLCVFSYLYRDNVCYKLAESIIVGVSAGYWIVLSFWEVLVAKVLVKLSPDVARYAFLPDTPLDAKPDYWYVVPVVLGCLVFCRWVPKIAWLGRWPLAFVVGTTAGLKLILFLDADFVSQIRSTILPLIAYSTDAATKVRAFDWKQSVQNIVLVAGVLSSLTYFYFSVEHKGVVGRISRAGVWVLMITFGASFALTVMGRITLLTMRLQFLFDDWLGLVRM
jgi:hypothetical protein